MTHAYADKLLAIKEVQMPLSPLLSHVSMDKLLSPSETHLQPQNGIIAVYPHYIRQCKA